MSEFPIRQIFFKKCFLLIIGIYSMYMNKIIDILKLLIQEQEGSDPRNPDVYPDQDEWGFDDAWTWDEWKIYYESIKKKHGEVTAKKIFLKYWEVVEAGTGVVADNDMDPLWFKQKEMWNGKQNRPYTRKEFEDTIKYNEFVKTPPKINQPKINQPVIGVSNKLVEFVKKEELFVPCVYDDAKGSPCIRKDYTNCCLRGKTPKGIATIGYGTVYYPNQTKVSPNDKNISIDVATKYLKSTLDSIAKKLLEKYPKLTQTQLDGLASLCYNVGVAGCTSKAPNLSAAIKKDPNPKTNPKIKPNFLDFANQKRRQKEYAIYSSGNYDIA